MKKVILLGVVLVGMVSCNKEYTCKCTSTFEDGSSLVEYEDYSDIKKDEAETSCATKAINIGVRNSESGLKSNVDWSVTVK